MISFIHRDIEEIRQLSKKNDLYFASLLYENEQFCKLLDAYSASLIYLDEKLKLKKCVITDRSNENYLGINGKLAYTHQHFSAITGLLNVLFTPSHEIWMKYNPADPIWSGERDKEINSIRRNLVNDFIPRITMIIKGCQDGELQQKEL